MAPMDYGQQLQGKIAEDLAKDDLADDDRRQANDDGAAAHVDVRRSPGTGPAAPPDSATRPLEIIRPSTLCDVGVDALGTGHVGVGAGGAQRAAQLRAKKPVQHGRSPPTHKDEPANRRVVQGHIPDIASGHQQVIFVHAHAADVAPCPAHDAQVDGIQGQLGQNAGQDGRDAACTCGTGP